MSENIQTRSNVPEFSVSDLAFSLKKTLEDNYGRVRVRGELSRVMVAGSGHMYSSLKDDQAVIDAVCWKGTLSGLSVRPEEGLEVICTGRVSSYPKSSKYQLVIESMELAGEGALLKMLEERKRKLASEGLFDKARKKPLPFLPEIVGVVTSPTGAVIRDILHRLSDRFPRHVLVWPVLVQGAGAAEQIAAAIKGFDALKDVRLRPDVLIVARGGGSLEDLMAFNEECVVRAAAACSIPLISAVGHETDTTLIDYAADLRAPTPTGAAEMAVPVRADLAAQVLEGEQRLLGAATRLLSEHGHRLEAQSAGLKDPARILDIKAQALDYLSESLTRSFSALLGEKRTRIVEYAARLRHPKERVAEAARMLERWVERFEALGPKLMEDRDTKLTHLGEMLEAYSFERVLQRGFAVVRSTEGAVISAAAQITGGQALEIQFKDNERVTVTAGTPSRSRSPKKGNTEQQSLF